MKKYLAYFEFVSGDFESYFYKDILADDDRDAIIQVVGYCLNLGDEDTNEYLIDAIGENWSIDDFWQKANWFDNGSEAYYLIWIEEFDINQHLAQRYRKAA